VLCRTKEETEQSRRSIERWLGPIGLRLSSEKTGIVRLSTGFDFLGHADLRVMPTSPRRPWSEGVERVKFSA
jgi:hypothetical protein